MSFQSTKTDLSKNNTNKHQRYGTTTITISKDNCKTLQELAIEGQSYNQVLSQILRNTITKLLLEQYQKKLVFETDDEKTSQTTNRTSQEEFSNER